MNRLTIILVLSFFILFPQLNFSQEKKPKVVLVLSGGGAKGVAHIPLLQAMDSLGIVPDLIIGTSMGSIVGGLYAAGYSGDSIASITNNIDWDDVLGGNIPLSDVSVEEKAQFKKYVAEIDLVKGKPKVSSSLLNDQKIRELFALLAYPVFDIKDFDNLPIPYRAMTTDIVNGKEVLLEGGSLPFAMRSSMSIPGVFSPVPYNDVLLVDGGILNNFPVDVAIEMGGEIIIGSDVSGGMQPIDKLNSIPGLIFQSSMLTSNLKNEESKSLCTILVDHVPNLTYSTGDFDKSSLLYEEGKIATNLKVDELAELASQLKQFKQREHHLPKVDKSFILDTIIYKGISPENIDLVKARANIETNKEYVPEEIIEGINRAMGTTIFNKITFIGIVQENDKRGLEITGFEHAKHQVKGSLHYDTYRGVGLIANYTGRNFIGKSSRFFVSIDIAEQPKFRVQYQKNFGKRKTWWWRSDALFEHLKQNVYVNGDVAEKMKYNYFLFENQINKNINSLNSFVGIGLNYELTNITPTINPKFSDNELKLDKYRFNNLELYGHYVFNNLNSVFYATKGTFLTVSLGKSFYSHANVAYYEDYQEQVTGKSNGYTKTIVAFEKRIPLNKKIAGIIGANANFIFEDALQSDEISFHQYGYAQKYFLGGNLPNQRKNSFMFYGLNEDELNVSQFMKLHLGLQFNPINKMYFTPHFDIASVGFNEFNEYIENAFSPSGNWTEYSETSTIMSAGVTAAYHSFMGPINFDVSWVNNISDLRIFFSIGLILN